MAIPITYNVRNLRLRVGATMMTALGIALTVAVAVFIMALLAGLVLRDSRQILDGLIGVAINSALQFRL